MNELQKIARQRLLLMHYQSQVGHIGSCLSCIDAILFLFNNWMNRNQDVFILSKGHAAGALYTALWSIDEAIEEDLMSFCKDGTKLAAHPESQSFPSIEFFTGSLGHGLSLSAGVALGKKLAGESGHVYCLTSDGEWQEGATWEALIFLTHHKLFNLTVLVDSNELQAFGTVKEVASMNDLKNKIASFGATVLECDGHNFAAINSALDTPSLSPRVIILHTVKGKGVSFMENKIEWHYLTLNEDLLKRAQKDIAAL